jgi:predicted RNA-binding Zn ribbon-like protein
MMVSSSPSTENTPTTPAEPPAPDGLDLVIDYVNTLDVEDGTDELAAPAGLAAWLAGRGLLGRSAVADEAELARAVELREALRALMLANGGADAPTPWATLEQAARRGELAVHFEPGGSVSTQPGARGVDGALARLLVPVADSLAAGTWPRAKACRADDCQWAFYDRSRNRSGVWCAMAVCGNRHKVRSYRARSPRRA